MNEIDELKRILAEERDAGVPTPFPTYRTKDGYECRVAPDRLFADNRVAWRLFGYPGVDGACGFEPNAPDVHKRCLAAAERTVAFLKGDLFYSGRYDGVLDGCYYVLRQAGPDWFWTYTDRHGRVFVGRSDGKEEAERDLHGICHP